MLDTLPNSGTAALISVGILFHKNLAEFLHHNININYML